MKRKSDPAGKQLEKSLARFLDWAGKGEGLSEGVRRAYRGLEEGVRFANAAAFLSTLQKERRILEELYVWASESKGTTADSEDPRNSLKEGISLVESLFSILEENFNVHIIHEPGKVIPTPPLRSRSFVFSDRYRKGVAESVVLFPGLRNGTRFISACEVEQRA